MNTIRCETQIINAKNQSVLYHPSYFDTTDSYALPHWHESLEILLITEGGMQYMCHGLTFSANVGDVLMINPNDIHSLRLHPEHRHCWHDCLLLSPIMLNGSGVSLENTRFFPFVRSKTLIEYYQRTVDAYRRLQRCETPIRKFTLQSEAQALISQIIQHYSHSSPENIKEYSNNSIEATKNILTYIENHLREPITLDAISQHVHYSTAYICRAVRTHLNTSITDLINSMRCQRAHSLLSQEKPTISEVAYMTGFNTLSYFSKTYLRYIGELPSDTRKKHH